MKKKRQRTKKRRQKKREKILEKICILFTQKKLKNLEKKINKLQIRRRRKISDESNIKGKSRIYENFLLDFLILFVNET